MDGQQLAQLYKIRFSQEQLSRKNAIWVEICKNYLQKLIPLDSTVVDIACGYGEFINNIQANKKIAVDLNPEAKNFLEEGVEFHQLPATEFSSVIQNQADVIFISNFLEHLPNKTVLENFLDEAMSALKPGAKLIIMGPNLRYLAGQYWDYYDHHLGLTHLSLMEVLMMKGFNIELCIDRFLPFTTQGALPTHPFFVKLYLLLPIAWKLLGKQFLIVATKPR
jgi:SAM-dependent methyltransferase